MENQAAKRTPHKAGSMRSFSDFTLRPPGFVLPLLLASILFTYRFLKVYSARIFKRKADSAAEKQIKTNGGLFAV